MTMRLWFREIKENRTIRETVITDDSEDTRTHKVLRALQTACSGFDLPLPIWLKSCETEFARSARTRFGKDSFIEDIDFDYLDVQVLEEDIPGF